MKGLLRSILITVGIGLFFCPLAYTESFYSGPDGVKSYKLLLKKFEISTDKSNWVTLEEGDVWIDVASVAPNTALLANYATNTNIPAGTYRYYRLTMGANYFIKGFAKQAGTTYYTTSHSAVSLCNGNPCSDDDSTAGIASTNKDDYAECELKVNTYSTDPGFGATNGGDFFTWTQPFSQALVVKEGEIKKITITFNIGNGIEFRPNGWGNSGIMFGAGSIIPVVEVEQ